MKQADIEKLLISNTENIRGLIEVTGNLKEAITDNSKRHADAVSTLAEKMGSIEGNVENLKDAFGVYREDQEKKEVARNIDLDKRFKELDKKYSSKLADWFCKIIIASFALLIIGAIFKAAFSS